jgi:selenium-binding protein 1
MAKIDVEPGRGMAIDARFLAETGDRLRPHQVKLAGGDASSDSFCFG